jgi:tRNA pseudouridine55 synthase
MDGVIVVDKPSGWTSHDAVGKLRRLANQRRIGHLGTLDPMATGVLPLVLGRATRLSQFYTASDKWYEAVVRFGYSTNTYDREGEPTSPATEPKLDRDELDRSLDRFRGRIMQTPPPVSAKKIGGVRAYKLARKNKPVDLKPVEVTVYSLRLVHCDAAEARIEAHCSAGTYLRSIAHDLGQILGCGAFLADLRRTRSGPFTLDLARSIVCLEEMVKEGRIEESLIPAAELLPEYPAERVDSLTAGQIRQGRDFRTSPFQIPRGSRYVRAISPEGDLIAIGEARLPNLYHPILVL